MIGITTEGELVIGNTYELRLYLESELTIHEVQWLEDRLRQNGLDLVEPLRYDARILSIKFRYDDRAEEAISPVFLDLPVGIIDIQLLEEEKMIWPWFILGGAVFYLVSRRKR